MLAILSLFLLKVACVTSYKIAIFAPDISNSQIIWNARVAETLADAGHNVTLIRMKYSNKHKASVPIKESVRQTYAIAMIGEADRYADLDAQQNAIIFSDAGMWESEARQVAQGFAQVFIDGCEALLRDQQFLSSTRSEHYDLAFVHMYDFCSIGLIRHLEIPTWIWLNSGAIMDYVSWTVGSPMPASWVPPMMMDSSDTMGFFRRLSSFIGHALSPIIYPMLVTNPETELFRKYADKQFPNLWDLAKECPLVMVNSNELYDLPRPTLYKIINIGGLGMRFHDAKPLTGVFKDLVDKSKAIVVVSFGSVANATRMPESWKKAFIGAFKRFPEHDFIIRYDIDDLNKIKSSNVHLHKWLPQTDLLQNAKTKAFITHGGYNGLQEAIHSATPIITIPLFGDQFKNGRIGEKHGFGYYLSKSEMTEERIVQALRAVLEDPRYSQSVHRLQRMVANRPIEAEKLLVRWTEFLAEFRELPNLVPAGNQLSLIQYFCLDVIAFLLLCLSLIFYIIYRILLFIYRLLKRCFFGKAKKQKQT